MIKPNLPCDIVNNVIVSCEISEQMEFILNSFEIYVNRLYGNFNVSHSIINHPDIYISHFSNNKIFSLSDKYKLSGKLDICDTLDNVFAKDLVDDVLYPYDAILNCVVLNDCLICNTKTVHPNIINYAERCSYRIIDVRQGYTKCNICVVDENSIITEDVGIYNSLTKYGFDVLLLRKNEVSLKGYTNGFIGGASGKISADKLCFYGNIKLHSEYPEIFKFLYNRGVEAISLSSQPVYDFGSIIPL